ncbi:HMI005Wp (mitochondrion) [Eremothecium sinecaudum]|uniref:ATP synthase protein 8 n=1 Tax=Eremothecium sinecaudum TaxID=45286 RepID=A0A0X8HWZ0_9SACH|nr:HMI005Wp [Eremothecium sinecaudum]AMD23031.1 HMI005Wp [Eremothecium sinecaudum]
MPQLVPFYFMNQLFYGFLTLSLILITVSQYILPTIIKLYVSRLLITKL